MAIRTNLQRHRAGDLPTWAKIEPLLTRWHTVTSLAKIISELGRHRNYATSAIQTALDRAEEEGLVVSRRLKRGEMTARLWISSRHAKTSETAIGIRLLNVKRTRGRPSKRMAFPEVNDPVRTRITEELQNWRSRQYLAAVCKVSIRAIDVRLKSMDVTHKVMGRQSVFVFILKTFSRKPLPIKLPVPANKLGRSRKGKLPEIGYLGINFEISRRLKAIGLRSSAVLAKRAGCNPAIAANLVYGRCVARNQAGEWSEGALTLAKFFDCLPDDLFNHEQQWPAGSYDAESIRLYEHIRLADTNQARTPDELLSINELKTEISKALSELSSREQSALRLTFGLGCKQMNLDEVAVAWGYTREGIRHICQKAMRQLVRSHGRRLRLFLDFEDDASSTGPLPPAGDVDWFEDVPKRAGSKRDPR